MYIKERADKRSLENPEMFISPEGLPFLNIFNNKNDDRDKISFQNSPSRCFRFSISLSSPNFSKHANDNSNFQ